MTDAHEDAPLSYEQARAELAQVVQTLEAGGTTLEEALRLWERGEQLARICQEWLDGARRRLSEVVDDAQADPARDQTSAGDQSARSAGPADGESA